MDSFKVDFLVYQDEACNVQVFVHQMEAVKNCVGWSDGMFLLGFNILNVSAALRKAFLLRTFQ